MGAGWVGGGAGLRRAVDTPADVRHDRGGHTYRKPSVSSLEIAFGAGFDPLREETPLNPANGSFPLNFVMIIKQIVDSR